MTARHLFPLLSFIIFSFHYCIAQSKLEGTVTDPRKDAIPYATISLSGPDSTVISTVQSDSLGNFTFRKLTLHHYRLSVYALGFARKNLNVQLQKNIFTHIILQPLKGALNEVTIVGNKAVIERKPDRLIYNVSNSINAAGSNGLEALSKVPGIKISDNNISLAGRGSLGVMINDRLLHLSGEALTQYLKSLSAAQIARIEVISHPSARYDATGNAGLINIITQHSHKSGISGDIQGSIMRFLFTDPPDYGVPDYGYISGGVNLNYNTSKWTAYSSINYSSGRELEGYGIDIYYPGRHWAMGDTGDYKHRTINMLAGADYKLNTNTTIGFQYMFEKETYIGADYVHDPIYNNTGAIDSTLRTYAIYYPIALSNSFNLHVLNNIGKSGGKLTVDADYFNYYRTDKSDFETHSYNSQGKLNPSGNRRYRDTTKQNIRVYTMKADLELPTPFAKFMLGSKISFIDNYSNIFYYDKTDDTLILNQSLSNEFQYKENTQALYVSGTKETGKWKIAAGIRGELTQTTGISYFSKQKAIHHYLKLFPSLLVSYKKDAPNSFSIMYSKRINRPTFWNLNPYKSLMTAYSYVEGNPYLQPEYNTNIALSHTYKDFLISSLYLNVTNNGFTNVTIASTDSNYIHTTPLNFIKTRLYGLSESVSVTPFRWLESANQVNVYYTNAHSSLPYINGIRGFGLYIATNNTVAFNKSKTIMGAANFWCQFPEVDHIGRSDTYYKLDLGLKVLALQKKLSISLNATDLLRSSGPVIRTTVNNIHESYTNFQVFSNIKLSATWHFGDNGHKRQPVKTGNEAERSRTN